MKAIDERLLELPFFCTDHLSSLQELDISLPASSSMMELLINQSYQLFPNSEAPLQAILALKILLLIHHLLSKGTPF